MRTVRPGCILLELPALLRTHQSMGPEVSKQDTRGAQRDTFTLTIYILILYLHTYVLTYTWGLSTWTFVETPVAFLLLGKMTMSYERWWERPQVEISNGVAACSE